MAAMTNGDVKSRRQLQAAEGPATVMAIGTAVPPFVHEQSTYADYYFDVTNCNHKTELKAKFKRICESQDDNIHGLRI
jgi:chalcone synthase